ncbi:hypothetical protein HGRIS_008312 [Hohenbuehelia grisea]|uniref:Metallo-dependent hydrolase n=1 Tax=Hohenbuehelia grisea TaxID=104357 RepID=A0ABR3J809_9AGAR
MHHTLDFPLNAAVSGHHPWFSHHISVDGRTAKEAHYRQLFSPKAEQEEIFERLLALLPEPTPLEQILSTLRNDLQTFPNAMLGEVGIDRTFRVAMDYFANPRQLTPFTIPLEHQLTVLEAQIDLAVELGRNISLHSVKTQQVTMELINRMAKKHGERWTNISLDMHSCGLSPQTWLQLEKAHPNVFLSLSTAINGRSPNLKKLIATCAPERILVESDLDDIRLCTERTWAMVLIIAEVKGWAVEKEWADDVPISDSGVVRRLEGNWKGFQRGRHKHAVKQNRAARKADEDFHSEGSEE